ncbi:MAG TPA: TIGR00645 family protein [Xanthomonadales bacterium]|nr:TIGR00645 family protein [Xanthomonadales bacterium]
MPYRQHNLGPLPTIIFSSRWLQLPLYLGLIVAQGVYVVQFLAELWKLLGQTAASWSHTVGGHGEVAGAAAHSAETAIMLTVLGLIDVVMISNLLVMVIVGGYETFVSRLRLHGHPDQPEWLSHVNAAVLKVKLATAIIGISSIHLLASFIKADQMTSQALFWQTMIHLTFVVSAVAIAMIDRLMSPAVKAASEHGAASRAEATAHATT